MENKQKIIIYSTPVCPYCHMVKNFLKEKGIEYEDKNVAIDAAARQEMVEKSGQLGVPVVDIKGTIIVGFDKPKIKTLLNI